MPRETNINIGIDLLICNYVGNWPVKVLRNRGSPHDASSLVGIQMALPFAAYDHRGVGIRTIPNRNQFPPGVSGQDL